MNSPLITLSILLLLNIFVGENFFSEKYLIAPVITWLFAIFLSLRCSPKLRYFLQTGLFSALYFNTFTFSPLLIDFSNGSLTIKQSALEKFVIIELSWLFASK